MADFSSIQTTEQFQQVLSRLNDQVEALQKQLAGTQSNLVTGAIQWDSGQARWQKYDGSSFTPLASRYGIDVIKLQGKQTSTGATGDTIALRDSSGRIKASAPSASADVTRKAELDAHVNATGNVHNMTKAQIDLGNVSNDQQLKKASNFSDVPNKSSARNNLGLKAAATYGVGTSAGKLVKYEDIPKPGSASTSSKGLVELASIQEHKFPDSSDQGKAANPFDIKNQMGFALFEDLHDVTAFRNAGTNYTNNKNAPMMVLVYAKNDQIDFAIYVNNEKRAQAFDFGGNDLRIQTLTVIVPKWSFYKINVGNYTQIYKVTEIY